MSCFACCFVWVCILVSHNEEREHRLWDFENREEVTGGWRKLHNEELHDLCCSSNIIRVFRLRRKRRVEHGRETCMEGSGGERDHIQGGRVILKWSV